MSDIDVFRLAGGSVVSSEGEREGVRGRGRERMGKERDVKRSRSSDEEEPRCGALFIGGSQ